MSYDPRYQQQGQGYAPQGHPQGGYAPPQQQGVPPGFVDDFAMPDQAAWQKQLADQAENQEQARNGPQPRFVKHRPPQGRDRWADAAVGEKVDTWIWLCPAYDRTKPLFHKYTSHFGYPKGVPNGKRLACAGDECLICAAWYEIRYNKNQNMKQVIRATRAQTEFLYNVIHLSDDGDHNVKYQDQTLRRAAILTLKAGAQNQLNNILRIHGPQITHPMHGSMIAYTRLRKNAEAYGFEYSLAPGRPKPLPHRPPQLWHNLCRGDGLWNLEQLNPIPSPAEQIAYLKGIGAPLPHARPGAHQAPPQQETPLQGNYGGPPGFDDPYDGAPGTQNYGAKTGRVSSAQPNLSNPPSSEGWTQQYAPTPQAAPPQSQQNYAPQQGQWSPPHEFGEEPPQKYPNMPPSGGYAPQPAPVAAPAQAAPQQGGIPPAPSVYGAPAANQGPPAPPAGAYGVQGTPAAPSNYAPVAQGSRQAPPQSGTQPSRLVKGHLPPGSLPGSRERCFGSHDEGYTRCVECPQWIKDQCIPQTPRGGSGTATDPAGEMMARQLASDTPF